MSPPSWQLDPSNNQYYYFSQPEQCYVYQSGEKIYVRQSPGEDSSIRDVPRSLPRIGHIRSQSTRTELASTSQSRIGPPPPLPRPLRLPPPPPHLTLKLRLPRRYQGSPARIIKRIAIIKFGYARVHESALEVSFSDDGEDNVSTAR